MIIHVRLTHEVWRVTISIRDTSPSHSYEISIDKGAVHLQDDIVLVDTGLRSKSWLDDRLILYFPIEIVDGFIDRIAQIVLSEHGEPAEVKGTTQVETCRDSYTIIIWNVWSHELCLSTLRIIALSSQTQDITKGLVSEASHESNRIVTSIIDVAIGRVHCSRSECHVYLSDIKDNLILGNIVALLVMYSLFKIHRVVSVVLDLPLRLVISVVHLRQYKVSSGTIRVLRHIENHIIICLLQIAWSTIEFF